MTYRHYFEPLARKLLEKEVEIIKNIISESGVIIRGPTGCKDTEPVVNSLGVCLNGDLATNKSCQSFQLVYGYHPELNCCDTNKKPYDKVVVSICYYLKRQHVLNFSSEGYDIDHLDSVYLLKKVLTKNLIQTIEGN